MSQPNIYQLGLHALDDRSATYQWKGDQPFTYLLVSIDRGQFEAQNRPSWLTITLAPQGQP